MSATVTVLEAEHFESLPKETQKMIKSLSDDFNIKQLNVFNPLVEAMATIEGFIELNYDPDNKECIDQYKGCKKFVGSFNATTKKTKSKLKKPILETGRKLDAIEKTFLARAKEVMELVNTEFKPYLDEKEKEKQEAEAKKNKASTDKIAELSEQTVEQTLVIERSKAFNKHMANNQNMLDTVLAFVDNYSEDALKTELAKLKESDFSLPQEDENVLLIDQVVNLQSSYEKMKDTCVRMINMRLVEIETERNEAKMNAPLPPMTAAQAFEVPSVEGKQSFGRSFTEVMDKAVATIKLLPTQTDKEATAKNSAIGGLQGYTLKILNFIDNGEDN